MSTKQSKASFRKWLDAQLHQDLQLRQEVEQTLNELRLEQDLIALREARGLSQNQLAKLVGVSQPAIAKIESGRIKNLQLKTLLRTAMALGATVNIQILKASDAMSPRPVRTAGRAKARRSRALRHTAA
jgi:DNA-binding XRE family transcriptional regulator